MTDGSDWLCLSENNDLHLYVIQLIVQISNNNYNLQSLPDIDMAEKLSDITKKLVARLREQVAIFLVEKLKEGVVEDVVAAAGQVCIKLTG